MAILLPDREGIARAAAVLQSGGLVVIPTETVYGLAANALDADAVRRIFAAKGRPSDNPLIVHVADEAGLRLVAKSLPEHAARLVKRFWPGPLTLVLPKTDAVPDETTGGLDTVAVRMPSHPVALELLRACGLPLAAPSANRFMRLSPTRADHVDPDLAEFVLDGGPCQVGLESTVVDCTGPQIRILRPGAIHRADLAACLGQPLAGPVEGPRRSPGQYRKHYAPRTPVRIVVGSEGRSEIGFHDAEVVLPRDPAAYGSQLYAALHVLDARGLAEIRIQAPPETAEWEAVWDRLRRATGTQ